MIEEVKKAEDIASKSGSNAFKKKVRKQKGLHKVEFLKDHGNFSKGDSAEMHKSTADALAHHKIVKVGEKITVVKKVKR